MGVTAGTETAERLPLSREVQAALGVLAPPGEERNRLQPGQARLGEAKLSRRLLRV